MADSSTGNTKGLGQTPALMRRAAFRMQLKEGCADEYKRRHDALWPEIASLLRQAGIREYSIFLDEASGALFAFQKLSGQDGSQDLGNTEIVQKWWAYMADIMETNEDFSPVSVELREVFYLP